MGDLYLKLIGQIENIPTGKGKISENVIRDVTRGMNLNTGTSLKDYMRKNKILKK